MPKIKILQIISSLDRGGAERVMADLCRGLDKEKFEVRVIVLKRLGPLSADLTKAGIDFELFGLPFKFGVFKIGKLTSLIREFAPDVVHTHLFASDFYGTIAACRAGVKAIVSTEHNINIGQSWIRNLIQRLAHRRQDVVVAVSGAVRDYLIAQAIPADRITVINNGIDLEKFHPAEKITRDQIIIGALGRLDRQKGFDVLIRALARIKDRRFQCVIAGAGQEYEKLEKLINCTGLATKVRLVGSESDNANFYRQADIFVVPSRWEGFGIVVLEAGATGLPVIASDVDGIRDIIESGQNGLMVPKEDESALAEAIVKLMDDPAERMRLGSRLERKVREQFSLAQTVRKHEELYLGLVK